MKWEQCGFVQLVMTDGKPLLVAVDMIAVVAGVTPGLTDTGDLIDGCNIYLKTPLRFEDDADMPTLGVRESYDEVLRLLELEAG